MEPKLCCVLSSAYKCAKCPKVWCEECWDVGRMQGTHYTTNVKDNGNGWWWMTEHEERIAKRGRKLCEEGRSV